MRIAVTHKVVQQNTVRYKVAERGKNYVNREKGQEKSQMERKPKSGQI